jgi:hypothetical protein
MLNRAVVLSIGAISLILITGLEAQANPATCNSVIREVRSQIQQRHRVTVLRDREYSIEDAGYANPLYDAIRSRNIGYELDIAHDAAGLNFIHSPATMRAYAQKIADHCPSAALVSFGLDQTDAGSILGLDHDGQMFHFECVDHDLASSPMPWGYTVCL